MFEAVRIRQQGFPFRLPYRKFYGRYHMIADIRAIETEALGPARTSERGKHKEPWDGAFYRTCCEAIVKKLLEEEEEGDAGGKDGKGMGSSSSSSSSPSCFVKDLRFGSSMVLYRAEPNRKLQRKRDRATRAAAPHP